MNRPLRRIRRQVAGYAAHEPQGRGATRLAALLGAAAALLLLLRLFAGGTVGLSDAGDGTRLLCGLGLRESDPYNSPAGRALYVLWPEHTWYGEDCGASGTGERVLSSQLGLVVVARLLSGVSGTAGLDLRVLGVLLALLVGGLVGLVARLLPGTVALRAGLALGLLLVLADGAFAGYLVSAYPEPAAFLGVLLMVAGVLVWIGARRLRWWTPLPLMAGGLLAATATPRTGWLMLPAVALLLARPSRGRTVAERLAGEGRYERATGTAVPRARYFLLSRWPALLLSAGLLAGTAAYQAAQPDRVRAQDDYAAVFTELLPHSPDPAGDLRALGLPESMATSAGRSMDDGASAAASPAYAAAQHRIGLVDRLRVYLRHPVRLVGLSTRGLEGMGPLRPGYLGSYPPGEAGETDGIRQECRVCVVQTLWRLTFDGGWFLFGPVLLAALWSCAAAANGCADRRGRAVGAAGLLLAGCSVLQFWHVMLTGATDLVRRMVLPDLTFALLLVFAVASFACLRRAQDAPPDEGRALPAPRVPLDTGLPDRTRGPVAR